MNCRNGQVYSLLPAICTVAQEEQRQRELEQREKQMFALFKQEFTITRRRSERRMALVAHDSSLWLKMLAIFWQLLCGAQADARC